MAGGVAKGSVVISEYAVGVANHFHHNLTCRYFFNFVKTPSSDV